MISKHNKVKWTVILKEQLTLEWLHGIMGLNSPSRPFRTINHDGLMQTRNSQAMLCVVYTHSITSWKASISKVRMDRSSWKNLSSEQQKKGRGQQNDIAKAIKGIGQGSMNKTQSIFKFSLPRCENRISFIKFWIRKMSDQ